MFMVTDILIKLLSIYGEVQDESNAMDNAIVPYTMLTSVFLKEDAYPITQIKLSNY